MSEDAENTTTWQSDRRLRYLVPVIVALGLILFVLAVAASCGSRDNRRGLKPFRPTRVPIGNDASEAVAILTFSELNNAPDVYKNQRIRVTGDKMTILRESCRLYTGPVFVWGLIAEDLQLHALGYEAVVKRLPDGLTMTVEGIWRQYDGPLGCGKEPADGQAWYLQVERIISPNPLPLLDDGPFATIQVPLGAQSGVDITPLGTPSGTAVPGQPGIGITPLSTATLLPSITQPAPATATILPTSTTNSGLTTATRPFPGLTPSATLGPSATATESDPGSGGTDPTATPSLTPMPTVPGLETQIPGPTSTPYPGGNPSTPIPVSTSTPYPGSN